MTISGVIARQALRAPEAAGALRIFALFLPAGCLCAVLSGCFTACSRIRRLAALEIAEELASLLLVFWLLGVRRPATAAESCRAIALAGGLAEFAAAAAQLLLFRRDCRARPRERVPMDGHAAALGGAIVDGGHFDWMAHADKFPGLCSPDESYHGVTYAEKFGMDEGYTAWNGHGDGRQGREQAHETKRLVLELLEKRKRGELRSRRGSYPSEDAEIVVRYRFR